MTKNNFKSPQRLVMFVSESNKIFTTGVRFQKFKTEVQNLYSGGLKVDRI